MELSTIRKVLYGVSILLLVQSFMVLIGGLIAAHDTSKEDIPADRIMRTDKYNCGMIRAIIKEDCNIEDMDRGWFRRLYDTIQNEPEGIDTEFLEEVNAYNYIVGGSIGCSIAWSVVGMIHYYVAKQASIKEMSKGFCCICFILYWCFIPFICFSLPIGMLAKVESDCKEFFEACEEFRKGAIRSSREYLAYWVCSCVGIVATLTCDFYLAIKLCPALSESEDASVVPKEPPKDSNVTKINLNNKAEIVTTEGKSQVMNDIAKKYTRKFANYLLNKEKILKLADRKFLETGIYKTGRTELDAFVKLISDMLVKKDLPIPCPEKIQELLNSCYEASEGLIKREGFRNIFLEIFASSREALIKEYARSKAETWKSSKLITEMRPSDIEKIDKCLDYTNELYKEINKAIYKGEEPIFDLDEVTSLLGKLCKNYKVPNIKKEEVAEITEEMGCVVEAYDLQDLQMVTLATLCIARNLIVVK
eukprot:TRINITY_DN455_c0_g3_i1.p2 TRINITY_DN455_c0_g3~~TRINITY_DN455_c0_g3_i1.p2  ORF type:complete len:477 (+),score=44.16 TRINITY_DN455_c0_g3_i1:149-1579(+)